jgi:hypothetical protein
MEKIRIRDKHSGSATLMITVCLVTALHNFFSLTEGECGGVTLLGDVIYLSAVFRRIRFSPQIQIQSLNPYSGH